MREITPGLEPLAEEARKYENAEEFRKAITKDPELIRLFREARKAGFTAKSFWEEARKYPEGETGTMVLKEIDTHRVELVKLRPVPKVKISSPKDVVDLLREMEDYDREYVKLLHLDTKNRVIGVETTSIGTVEHALVHPRETAKGALLLNATSVVWVHNHPSGVCDPSDEDMKTYNRLKEVFDLLGIRLLDFIIIGKDCYYSHREGRVIEYAAKPPVTPKTYEELGILVPEVRESNPNSGQSLKIEISWSKYESKLRDLQELVEKHAESAHIDGDKKVLVIEEPDAFLIDELKDRGIKYTEIG